jgi:hypothetical protein
MHPLLESLRGAVPDTCENYWHLRSVSGEPTEQDLQTRGQFYARCEPQAGDIGDVEQFQPSPDQPPLREERAPALQLGEVELRGAADHMQARLAESHPTAGATRGRQCHTSVVGGSCTCAPRNSTKSAYSTGTAQRLSILATRARNPLA